MTGLPALEDLLVPSRSLKLEAAIDMKAVTKTSSSSGSESGGFGGSGGSAERAGRALSSIFSSNWSIRREYRVYLFTDVMMICQPKPRFDTLRTARATFRCLFNLCDLTVTPSNGSSIVGAAASDASSTNEIPIGTEIGTPSSTRAHGSSSFGSFSRWRSSSGALAREKPEVLRLHYRGAEYKCWAESEQAMVNFCTLVQDLKNEIAPREQRNVRRRLSFDTGRRRALPSSPQRPWQQHGIVSGADALLSGPSSADSGEDRADPASTSHTSIDLLCIEQKRVSFAEGGDPREYKLNREQDQHENLRA